jgi:hypothetical protein
MHLLANGFNLSDEARKTQFAVAMHFSGADIRKLGD